VPQKKRKVRKMRGSRTHGYGQIGQHRKAGGRGGKGEAGYHKHFWTYTVTKEPNHFGKHGFNSPTRNLINAINIGELNERIESLLANNRATKTKEGIAVDLTQLGYDKLLGKGKVTRPLIVRVESSSKSAAEKIEKAGGQIQKPSE